MADDLNIGVGINADKATSGAAQAKAAVGGITQSSKDMEKAFRALKSAIDPTWAAHEKYSQVLNDNRSLLSQNLISLNEFKQGMAAARTELNQQISALSANTAEARANAAAVKQAAAQKAADEKASSAAIKQAARDAANEQKMQARQAAAEIRAAKSAELAAIREAAAAAKASAREQAAVEKAAAQDAAEAVRVSKAQERIAAREAAQVISNAAKEKANAERAATAAAREAAEQLRREAIEARSLAAAERELRSSIDPAYAAQMRYNEVMRSATQLLMQNKLQAGEYTRIQKNAAQQMEINTRTIGRMNSGYVNLGYQMQDVIASWKSGISPLVILAQQGGQTASAIAQMGGKFSGVAAFMAGPWGAAILGATMILGPLIMKLFEAGSAADAMAASQANLKKYVDSTTGSIYAQVTATQRLAAAKSEADVADAKRKEAEQARKDVGKNAQLANRWTLPGSKTASTGAMDGFGTIGNKKVGAEVERLGLMLERGQISAEKFRQNMTRLGKTDADVRKLNQGWTQQIAVMQDVEQEAQKAAATQRVYLGTATAADKKLLGFAANRKVTSESALRAEATLKTATDSVERARAQQTITEERLGKVRDANLAAGMDENKANATYVAGMAPVIAAVRSAEQAKKDNNAATRAGIKAENEAAREAKRAAEEKLRYDIEDIDYKKELADQDFAKVMELQDQKIARLKDYYGMDNRNYVAALREKERLTKQHEQLLLSMELARIQRQNEIAQGNEEANFNSQSTGLKAGGDITDFQSRAGMINATQELEAKRAQLNLEYQLQVQHEERMYQLRLASLQKQAALLEGQPQKQAEINGQIEVLEAQHQNLMQTMASENFRNVQQINLQQAENTRNNWKMATDSISQSMGQMFQDIWMHSGSVGQSLLNMADQLVFKYVNAGIEIAANWVANELAKTASSLLGITTRTTAETASEGVKTAAKATGTGARIAMTTTETGVEMGATAAKTGAAVTAEAIKTGAKATGTAADIGMTATAGMAEIGARAATSAAGAFSSTVVIPFIGPVAAPVAAAAALAAVMGFGALISAKGGLDEVPSDQLAMVHKKEMILPAWIAEPMRNALKSPRSMAPIMSAASMSGQSMREAQSQSQHLNFNYQPQHTNQNAEMSSMLRKDGAAFRKWMKNQARNGAFRMDQTR